MQENEFEKQFKDLMDEFKLAPSESVWEKVKLRLDTGKRKKRPFIFLLILSLVVAGYFMYHVSEKQTQNVNDNANIKSNAPATNNNSLKDSTKLFTEKIGDDEKLNPSVKNKNNLLHEERLGKKVNGSATPVINSEKSKKITITQNNLVAPGIKKDEVQPTLNEKTVNIKDNASEINTTPSQNITVQKQSNFINDSTKSLGNISSIDENNNPVNSDSIQINPDKKDSSLQKISKNSIKKKYAIPNWQWGVVAFYGKSNAVESLTDLDKSAPVFSLDPSTGMGNGNPIYFNNHPYSSSNAYQFGLSVQKKIIKNGFVSAGLNFIHLSTKTNVSRKIDSTSVLQNVNGAGNSFSVNRYFQPGTSAVYKNIYNFIELPVYFQQDLFPAKKFSFSYNAGVSLRQLISSDALIYDQQNSIYFSKDDLLRKTQVQLLAGLSLKINSGKNTAIYVGPQFSYSVSNLFKNSNYGNFHFVNYGLQAGFMFHKK